MASATLDTRLQVVRARQGLLDRAAAEIARAADDLDAFLSGRRAAPPLGPDPNARRGTLPWPAQGPVLVPFGTRRHPRFGTLLPHRGIAIGASPGVPVRAVAGGTVLFADWLTGYGRTVIVDHGLGVVSVVAHLASIAVRAGETMDQGRVVGSVGDSGTLEGVRLYFEVRRAGQPEDPRQWLAPSRGLQRP